MQSRTGEAPKAWFRCERFYHTAQGWWFTTREDIQQGPYISQHEAENELCLFLRNQRVFPGLYTKASAGS